MGVVTKTYEKRQLLKMSYALWSTGPRQWLAKHLTGLLANNFLVILGDWQVTAVALVA